jgi:hypothetical protein
VFVSTFKWEMRKGWDILLAAYLQEFTSDDNVELYILTKPFLAGSNFQGDMRTWARHHLNITEVRRAQQGRHSMEMWCSASRSLRAHLQKRHSRARITETTTCGS